MTLSPLGPVQEKPSRADRLRERDERSRQRRNQRAKTNARRRVETYGARNGTPKRADAKRDTLIRFGHRCMWAGTDKCETPRWRLEQHHWLRTVSSGATNAPDEVCLMCCACHSKHHAGQAGYGREDIRRRLTALGHITALTAAETDELQRDVERATGH